MTEMTGGHAVVQQLVAEGVDTVFAVPGMQVMHIYDGFLEAPGINLITCRHEQTAVFAADGYARTRGVPGVALIVPGPGAYNAGAAMATAMAGNSPVLLISGQIASHELYGGRGSLHEINDQLEFMAPVTKWRQRTGSADEIPGLIHEAFRQLKTGRPQPVEVEVPHDFLAERQDFEIIQREDYPRPDVPADHVSSAADILAEATRPLIWVGDGVVRAGASGELERMATALGAPVLHSRDAQGALPAPHPLAFEVPSPGYGDPATEDLLRAADVILVVGSRFARSETSRWDLSADQRLLHIDIDPAIPGESYNPVVSIVGDARVALAALNSALETRAFNSGWDPDMLAEVHGRRRTLLRLKYPEQVRAFEKLRCLLPDNTVIVGGVTVGSRWMGSAFDILQPGTLTSASYMTTLGYAFPLALGVKAGSPDRPVIALCGDGGFSYAIGDLATAVQHRINLVIVLFNNGKYGASQNDQIHGRFGGRVIGTDLVNPDFVGLAESFGVVGVRVNKLHDLPAAISDATTAGQPVLIDVVGDAMRALDHVDI
ncbi:MAG: thiamine pyrophosphate-binding protein [Chloroflexi bacterium]|nr:thiamine pyrophosphate-binding protein [Chloroflexota bacterium]